MSNTNTLRHAPRHFSFRRVSESGAGPRFFRVSRLWRAGLPGHPLRSRKFLARRAAVMESAQQLRRAVPGPMGDDDALSVVNFLPAFSFALVAGLFLFGASVA